MILTVGQLKRAITQSGLPDSSPVLGIDPESHELIGFTSAEPDNIEGGLGIPIPYLHLDFVPFLGTIDELAQEISSS